MTKELESPEEMPPASPYDKDEPETAKPFSFILADNLPGPEQLTIKQRGEVRAIADLIGEQYRSRVRHYKKILLEPDSPYKEELTPEVIHSRATSGAPIEYILEQRVNDISWRDIQGMFEKDPEAAGIIYQTIKKVAREGIAAGMLSAEAIKRGDTPYKHAQYGVVLEGFEKAWKPRDAIEQSMVETLVQAYLAYNHWLGIASAAAEYSYNAIERDNERDGRWQPPRLSADETIERAMLMADRFNRLYLRTLRQMRDLRRYSVPVTINNPKQVNIAADGGQQVNAVKVEE